MSKNNIKPEKITKPIQLMAVWFSALIFLVGLLLTAANTIKTPNWITPMLSIFVILIIPVFIYFIFLLQTKFRSELQDDHYFSLSKDYNNYAITTKSNESEFDKLSDLYKSFNEFSTIQKEKLEEIISIINNSNNNRIDNEKIIEITNSINEEANKIDVKVSKNIYIELNSIVPNFKQIQLELLKSGFEFINLFQGKNNKPPSKFLISIGKNIEPNSVIEILKLLKKIEDEIYLNYIGDTGFIAEDSRNKVIIGSYAYNVKERLTQKADTEFFNILTKISNKDKLRDLLKYGIK